MGVAKTRGCLPQEQTLHCRSMTTTHHTLHYRLSGQTQAQDRGCASRVVVSVPRLHATPYGVFINVGSFVLGCFVTLLSVTHTGFALLVMYCTHRCITVILEMRKGCFVTLLSVTHTGFALMVMYYTHRCITVILEMRKGCFTIRFIPVWV